MALYPYHYSNWSQEILRTQFIIQLAVLAFAIIIFTQLVVKNKARKSRVISAFTWANGFIILAIAAGTFPMVVSYFFHDVPILKGVPVGGGYYFWWTNLAYCFVVLGNIAIFKFIQRIFEKPTQVTFYIYLGFNIGFLVWNIYHGTFVVVPGIGSLTTYMGAVFLVLELYLWFTMLTLLVKTYKGMSTSVDKYGFFFMILGAATTLASNFLFAVGNILDLKVVMPLYWLFFSLTALLIYLGYVRPPWFKTLLERQLAKSLARKPVQDAHPETDAIPAMNRKEKRPVNAVLYMVGLAGAAVFAIAATLMYSEFFWATWTLNWYTFLLVTVAVVLADFESARIVVKILQSMVKKPFGSGRITPAHKVVPLIFLVAGISVLGYFWGPTGGSATIPPHLSFTGDPSTSITISWCTPTPYRGNVSFGTSAGSLTNITQEPAATSDHAITLQGLSPNTTYYYQVGGFSTKGQFKTASGTSEQVHFAAVSDPHNDFYLPVRDAIATAGTDFTIITGDFVDYGGWTASWTELFEQIEPIARNQSVMTAIGNHDAFFGGTSSYLKYFSMPSGSGDERWYHFAYNGVHFISLDLEWGSHSYTPAQQAWLEATLDSITPAEWVVVFNHCMHFTSGNNEENTGMTGTFHQLFVDHDVDLVISGHNHHAEIYPVDGVVYTVIGTASHDLTPRQHEAKPGSYFFDLSHQAYLDVTFNSTTCTLSILRFDGSTPMAPVVYPFPK